MGRGCMGICNGYETTHHREAYSRGFKYCAECRLFIFTQTIKCPCCKGFLRVKSHQPNKSKKIIKVPETIKIPSEYLVGGKVV